jgi:multiple sugar transport system substrate-binding protein
MGAGHNSGMKRSRLNRSQGRNRMKKFVVGAISAVALMAASQAMAQEKLTVLWVKGFYKAEDDALFEAIKKFETKTGVKVELSQFAIQDMIP